LADIQPRGGQGGWPLRYHALPFRCEPFLSVVAVVAGSAVVTPSAAGGVEDVGDGVPEGVGDVVAVGAEMPAEGVGGGGPAWDEDFGTAGDKGADVAEDVFGFFHCGGGFAWGDEMWGRGKGKGGCGEGMLIWDFSGDGKCIGGVFQASAYATM